MLIAAPPVRRMSDPEAGTKTGLGGCKSSHSLFLSTANKTSGVKRMAPTSSVMRLSAKAQAANKVPQRIGSSGANIYGMLVYDYEGRDVAGIYEIDIDGSYSLITPLPATGAIGGHFELGFFYVRNNKIVVVGQEDFNQQIYTGGQSWVYDMVTHEEYWVMHEIVPTFKMAAYDPVNDLLMGYYSIMGEDMLKYGTAPGSSPAEITEVTNFGSGAALPYVGITYNVDTRKIVGVKGSGQGATVVEIDPATGQPSDTGIQVEHGSKYISGVAYSPVDKAYIYAYCNEYWDYQGFDLLDPSTFESTYNFEYDRMLEWQQFICADKRGFEQTSPDNTTFVAADFANGDRDGSVTYRLADRNRGGLPLIGTVDWIFEIDGNEIRRGSGRAGTEVSFEVHDEKEGLHSFNLRSFIAGAEGRSCMTSVYLGHDTPKAPDEVSLTKDSITWTPVTQGANGGYVNADEVVYNVYIGEEILARNVEGTSCPTGFGDDLKLDSFFAVVVAVYRDKWSQPAFSYIETFGDYMEMPWQLTPEYEKYALFTTYDVNGGARIYYATDITLDSETTQGFFYQYDSDLDADDYLFVPATMFADAGAIYDFGASIFRMGSYTETYELVLATEPRPDKIVKVIKPETLLENTETSLHSDYMTHTYFTVPEAGVYYVGIHVTSPADMYRVVMTDFSLSEAEGMTADSPVVPVAVKTVPDGKGKLKASVEVTLPEVSISDEVFPAETILTVTARAAGCEAVSGSGKPGSTVVVEIPTVQGDNEVTVQLFNGEAASQTFVTNVYTGIDIPGAPADLTMTTDETGLTLHLSWNAPEQGGRGGYVEPSGIMYYLCRPNYYGLGDITPIGTDIFSYDVVLPQDAKQDVYTYGVFCENAAGSAELAAVASALAGRPLGMPYYNNYKAGQSTSPIVVYDDRFDMQMGNPGWMWSQFETPDNPIALFSTFQRWPEVELTDVRFSLPRFSTLNSKKAAFEFETFGGCVKSFTVYASACGSEPEAIKKFDREDFESRDITKVLVELPEKYQARGWVEIMIGFDTADDKDSFILYSWSFHDNLDNDFQAASIDGPAMLPMGNEGIFRVNIVNSGGKPAAFPGGVWKLESNGDDVIALVEVAADSDLIEPGDALTFPLSFTPSVENEGDFSLSFTLNNLDENAGNNYALKTFSVGKGYSPVITDLHAAEISHDKVSLAWQPLEVGGAVTESFEDEATMVIDTDIYSDAIGRFRRLDRDGAATNGAEVNWFQNLPLAFKPASWVVWSARELCELSGSDNDFYTNHGDKFIMAFSPAGYEYTSADDWLISPQVMPGTEISFSARTWTNIYGVEQLEVLYSAAGDDPDDFTLLEKIEVGKNAENPSVWEDFKVALPDDARYFALRYVSFDVFGLMLDNICYMPVDADITVTGFDIVRDGVLIAGNAPCPDSTYDDFTVSSGADYVYQVQPLLSDGTRGMLSNRLSVATSGVAHISSGPGSVSARDGKIVVKGYEGEHVKVVSADGCIVGDVPSASSSEAFAVSGGVYIVSAGKDSIKIVVR